VTYRRLRDVVASKSDDPRAGYLVDVDARVPVCHACYQAVYKSLAKSTPVKAETAVSVTVDDSSDSSDGDGGGAADSEIYDITGAELLPFRVLPPVGSPAPKLQKKNNSRNTTGSAANGRTTVDILLAVQDEEALVATLVAW